MTAKRTSKRPAKALGPARSERGDLSVSTLRAEAWKRIERGRERAIHVLAVHPGFVNVSAEARARDAARFDLELEVVAFYET